MYGINVLFLVDKLNKGADSALVTEVFLNCLFLSLVAKLDMNSRVQESLLAQTFFKDFILINGSFLEYLRVRLEANLRAALRGFSDLLQIANDLSSFITLKIDILSVKNLDLDPFGQSVDDRSADAVQTSEQ